MALEQKRLVGEGCRRQSRQAWWFLGEFNSYSQENVLKGGPTPTFCQLVIQGPGAPELRSGVWRNPTPPPTPR